MTYKEYADKAYKIIEAIKNGNYEEDLDAPNYVEEYEHEGKLFLIVVDRSGIKSSPYSGMGFYTVCGEDFDVTFELYDEHEFQSDFFDQAKNLEGDPDGIDVEQIIKSVKDALSTLFPDFSSVDGQAAAYAKAMGIERDYEAHWYEDENSHWKEFIGEDEDYEDEEYEEQD